MGEGYHIDPEEWGKHQQLVTGIHEAIVGENGVLSQLKALNSRTGKNESAIQELKTERAELVGTYDKRVSILENRPSSMKVILGIGAIITVLNALISYFKI